MSNQKVNSLSHFFSPKTREHVALQTRADRDLPRSKRQQIRHLSEQVSDLKELMSWLVAAMVVTDQPTAAAANAYEGLRSSVIQASKDRNRLLVTLAGLDYALDLGQDLATIQSKVTEEMERSGLTKTTATSDENLYDFDNDKPTFFAIEVMKPAYIDRESGALVRPGTARWIEVAPPEETIAPPVLDITIVVPSEGDAVPDPVTDDSSTAGRNASAPAAGPDSHVTPTESPIDDEKADRS